MKARYSRFFIKDSTGKLVELQARTKREAVEEVLWRYANCGKKTIVQMVFDLVETKECTINTDYE